MGFFDFLGSSAKSFMHGMQEKFGNVCAEEAMKLRKYSRYELKELMETVENEITKRAIIIAISMESPSDAARVAKEYDMSKSSFESLITNDKVGKYIKELLRNWPNYD